MPCSGPEGKLFLKDWLKCFQPRSILDVGAGSGVYNRIIKEVVSEPDGRVVNYKPIIHAVEIFEQYIGAFDLRSKYDTVFCGNILDDTLLSNKTGEGLIGNYDLIILGDIVEHISESDMIGLWPKLKAKSKFIFISIPLAKIDGRSWYQGYNQTPYEYKDNIYEKHVCNWDFGKFLSTFGPFLWVVPFKVVSVFIAEGLL